MSVYAQEYGYFFNSNNSDRTYNADSFERWMKPFFVSGVFTGCLQVKAQTTPDMSVQVTKGYANLDGKPAYWPEDNTLAIATASGVYDRIDTVVLRRDNVNRRISIEVVTGTASASPQPTAPTRTDDVFELVLAEVLVGVGVTTIVGSAITDKRTDTDVCGYVVAAVQTPDFSDLYEQFSAQAEEFMGEQAEDFLAWFDEMKDQLSEDAAGHLQLEVDALDAAKADEETVAIVQSGNTATRAIAAGQYVIWKGTACQANTDIASGTTLATSGAGANLTVCSDGIGNSLSEQIVQRCHAKMARWLRFDPENRKGLIIKGGTSIFKQNGVRWYASEDTELDFSAETLTAGKDYGVYLHNDDTFSIQTLDQTTPANAIKIGRFHTLCANVGTINMTDTPGKGHGLAVNDKFLVKPYDPDEDPDFYAFYNKTISAVTSQSAYDLVTVPHPLSGFEAGDILPESVFCLTFRPASRFEDGVVYDKTYHHMVDIYLQSGTGIMTRSVYNATHTVSRTAYNHLADMLAVGKRLLFDHEFTAAAIGSNEKTNITGSSDKTYVGGHVDTSNRRMISAIGCEEMCGYLWQWCNNPASVGGSGWVTTDTHDSFGQEYGDPYVLRAGGYWGNGSYCGSRSRRSADRRSGVNAAYGGRGSSRAICWA